MIGQPARKTFMTGPKILCLNMIVKNEIANLELCLCAVAPYVSCWVIGDTGSTDGSQEFIESFFAKRNIPGELHSFPFVNFEQARNAALDCAYGSSLTYDYLLLTDADMELVVEDKDFRTTLEGSGYRLLQRTHSGLAYWNTRLIRRDIGARYHGVTHEYLDVPGGVKELRGVWYKDHASGSNRVDKFERDIKLLLAGLKQEPENQRYLFYLAQSYRDAGRTAEAAKAYAKRADSGGWEEEAWYARLQEARCLRKLGDEAGFLRQALAAFNQRPQRAEPLYDLARLYREKGMNAASILFSEEGLAIKRPDEDVLFIEDNVYQTGLREEFSIAANYARDPARKRRGFELCDSLALDRAAPQATRDLAVSNLHFYVEPAEKLLPSFSSRPIGFKPPEGWLPTNPSIARNGDEIVLVQRAVNYTIDPAFPDGDERRYVAKDGAAPHTRNFLLRLDVDLRTLRSAEILDPVDLPEPVWPKVLGFEDMRLFTWRGDLWGVACVRQMSKEGWCEQVLARIDEQGDGTRLTDWRVLRPESPQTHEKNWMPRVDGDALEFVYHCDPTRVIDDQARIVVSMTPPILADHFRGGSQLIAFDGGWLALVHETRVRDGQRHYRHRFVWFDEGMKLRGVSRPFFFQKRGVEFAAGLAWHPDEKRLMITYGVNDSEAWIATVKAEEVGMLLADADRLPSGATGTNGVCKVALPTSGLALDKSGTNKRGTTKYEAPATRQSRANVERTAISELAVSSEAFDQQLCEPRSKVLICTTGRTGSFWLCRAMIDSGIGVPHEYFHDLHARVIGPRLGVDELRNSRLLETDSAVRRAYIEVLLKRRTVNGIFAAKIHQGQLERYLNNPEGLDLFQNAYFIYLHREDLLAQAISYRVAMLTGRWGLDGTVTSSRVTDPQFFDNAQIARDMEMFAADNTAWRLFFARNAIMPLTISYEEMKDDLPATLRKIVETFGLEVQLKEFNYGEPEPIEFHDPGTPSKLEIRKRFVQANQKIVAASFKPSRTTLPPQAPCIEAHKAESDRTMRKAEISAATTSVEERFLSIAPFLLSADSPELRREQSRAFDARISSFLDADDGAALPQIHCFYEIQSDGGRHDGLVAATASMRAAGHPVKVWSYSPQKLEFLRPHGVELSSADDIVPRSLFEKIMVGSGIRYFSDVFRYAVLYEYGGLWMDSDVILLRPFPFCGEHFFNLQWRSGSKNEHFVCGNVIFAKRYSRHLRNLYEISLERFFASRETAFGDIGPKLLSDYIASDAGAELRDWVFSPVFFNSIDWTEIDQFKQPISQLADYLNDERVFGVHLWNARTNPEAGKDDDALISILSDPFVRLPRLTYLADRFNTDKNRHTGNRHFYSRAYDKLLSPRRFSLRLLMEIGLCRIHGGKQTETPSIALWQSYFPYAHVVGVDLTDFSALNDARFTSFVCDQSKPGALREVAAKLEPQSFDVIIDDGSHASYDQQITLLEFFPLLAEGGWFFIEDLDWQPPGEDLQKITLTKTLLREIQEYGAARSIDPLAVSALAQEFQEILFFDSHYELSRAKLMGGLVAIRKRGGAGLAG